MTDTPEQRLTVSIDARIAEFEKAIENEFKPALKAAIAAVLSDALDEFLSGPVTGLSIKAEAA